MQIPVNYVFDMPHAHVFCLGDALKCHAIYQAEFQDFAVSRMVDVLVNEEGDLRRREGRQIMFHHIVTKISFRKPPSVNVCKSCDDGSSNFPAAYPPYLSQLVAEMTLKGFTLIWLFCLSM